MLVNTVISILYNLQTFLREKHIKKLKCEYFISKRTLLENSLRSNCSQNEESSKGKVLIFIYLFILLLFFLED